MSDHERIDGQEAYRDDAGYTAPEMEPGNGEAAPPEASAEFTVSTGAGMTVPAAGGALAGQVLIGEVEEERAEMTPNPDARA